MHKFLCDVLLEAVAVSESQGLWLVLVLAQVRGTHLSSQCSNLEIPV